MTSTMDSSSSTENITTKYYNANLAKFALMCYNAVDGARDTGSFVEKRSFGCFARDISSMLSFLQANMKKMFFIQWCFCTYQIE